MRVAELISYLQAYDGNLQVVVPGTGMMEGAYVSLDSVATQFLVESQSEPSFASPDSVPDGHPLTEVIALN